MLTFFQSSTFDFFLALISKTKYSLDIPHARSPLDWRAFSMYAIGAFSCQSPPCVGCYPQTPPAVCPRPHLFSSAQLRSDVICFSNDGQSSERWWVPLYTNTITEARRVISTGKEETVLKNDSVVSIVTFFALSLLQLFSFKSCYFCLVK